MFDSVLAPTNTDDPIEEHIISCLNLGSPQSFFLYAGAGSGKTYSLVHAIQYILKNYSRELMMRGQSVAVITYTNAAADEVGRRLNYNQHVIVSTIHSFAWSLIRPFQNDIRSQLKARIKSTIQDLESKSSRAGTKAETTRIYNLARAKNRIEAIDSITEFTYSPTAESSGEGVLSHTEVIALTTSMIEMHPLLSKILATKYPYLFIDESQDTNSGLLDALLKVQNQNSATFCLGLFGDTMQRIYADGKQNLEEALDDTWAKPAKKMNHRSASRIVALANSIRAETDQKTQFARSDQNTGFVRLFLVPNSMDITIAETRVLEIMAQVTNDNVWRSFVDGAPGSAIGVKKLILEHQMAAIRLGFSDLFDALVVLDSNRTSILKNTHKETVTFTRDIVPMVEAIKCNDSYALHAILRSRSPLLSPDYLRNISDEERTLTQHMDSIQEALSELISLWEDDQDPKLFSIAKIVERAGIFTFEDAVTRALSFLEENGQTTEDESQPWVRLLKCAYSEVASYSRYINDETEYTTHQGVKGLEFPRVMAIMSDDEARGFLFSYEKLFGAKELTTSDLRNMNEGKETSIDRTRRLFYVSCTRAIESLAVVVFTSDPETVAGGVLDRGWFNKGELEIFNDTSTL